MVIEKRAATPPLITVLVLSYNHERFIKRKMLSLASQTLQDFEVIYLDNCSADSTFEKGVEVLEEFGLPFVAIKTEQNLGISKGVNLALKSYCRTELYCPASGDDWWDFANLESRLQVMKNNPEYDVVYGNGYVYNEATKEMTRFFKQPQPPTMTVQYLLNGGRIFSLGTLYKYSVMESVGFYDESSKIEDWDLFLRIAERYTIGYDHVPTTFYRTNHSSSISRNNVYMSEGIEIIYKKYEADYPTEIARARSLARVSTAYHLATHEPSFKNLMYLIRHYKLNAIYSRQVIKCAVNLFRK